MGNFLTGRMVVGAALLALPMAVGLAACSDDDDIEDPSVEILSPDPGDTVELESDDMTVSFRIDTDDFDLDEADECAGDLGCGQAVLRIDGDACNAPGLPYNAVTTDDETFGEATLEANFSFCPAAGRLGPHQVTVSLRRADGSPVMRLDGTPAEAMVPVMTEFDDD
jgi:hypothetical protein